MSAMWGHVEYGGVYQVRRWRGSLEARGTSGNRRSELAALGSHPEPLSPGASQLRSSVLGGREAGVEERTDSPSHQDGRPVWVTAHRFSACECDGLICNSTPESHGSGSSRLTRCVCRWPNHSGELFRIPCSTHSEPNEITEEIQGLVGSGRTQMWSAVSERTGV